jgi:hypothetical protein
MPGHNIKEYSRFWYYTSADYTEDATVSTLEDTAFSRMQEEAYTYAKSLPIPGLLNWVTVEVMWL